MKNGNIHFLKGISLSFCILTGIMCPVLFNFFDLTKPFENSQISEEQFVTSINGKS